MFKLFTIKQTVAFGLLSLIIVGCSSYTPYRYSFSLIEPQNKTMSFEDENVQFKFVPSAENIWIAIKNKTGHAISLVRENAKYIDSSGESLEIHYGNAYEQEVVDFANDLHVFDVNIDPNSEITGYAWINNWPDFHLGQGPGNRPISTYNISNRMEPFFPRYSFEGKGEDLKNSTFNLVLPIDFGGHVRDYTFTFKIDDAI